MGSEPSAPTRSYILGAILLAEYHFRAAQGHSIRCTKGHLYIVYNKRAFEYIRNYVQEL